MPTALAIQVKLIAFAETLNQPTRFRLPNSLRNSITFKKEKPLLRILRATRAFSPRIYYYSLFESPFIYK